MEQRIHDRALQILKERAATGRGVVNNGPREYSGAGVVNNGSRNYSGAGVVNNGPRQYSGAGVVTNGPRKYSGAGSVGGQNYYDNNGRYAGSIDTGSGFLDMIPIVGPLLSKLTGGKKRAKRGPTARGQLVSKLMKEKGMTLGEASSYISKNNLH